MLLRNQQNVLVKLIRQFYSGSLDIDLQDSDISELTWSKQEEFLNATVKSNLLLKYPVKKEYTGLFFKKLIQLLEPTQDIHDDIYKILCTSMKTDNDYFYYRHYIIDENLQNIVTIKETRNMVVNGTTGLRTWEAAFVLCDWVLCNKEQFYHKKVLELGSGVGFSGITIAKFGQTKSVLLSDYHDDVLKTIEENIKTNFPNLQETHLPHSTVYKDQNTVIGFLNLDWNKTNDFPNDIHPDVIIGADIVYDPSILQPLCNVLQRFSQNNNLIEIYIAGVLRNEDTYKLFLKSLDSMNFHYQKLEIRKNVHVNWSDNMDYYLLKINKSI